MLGFSEAMEDIHSAFADLEPVVFVQDGLILPGPIHAIRSEGAAPSFPGEGSTLRTITYEFRQADLPQRPTKRDSFAHRGRRWGVINVTCNDDVGAWMVVVSDAGPAA